MHVTVHSERNIDHYTEKVLECCHKSSDGPKNSFEQTKL